MAGNPEPAFTSKASDSLVVYRAHDAVAFLQLDATVPGAALLRGVGTESGERGKRRSSKNNGAKGMSAQ